MSILSWVVSNILLTMPLAASAWILQRRFHRFSIAHLLWTLVLLKLLTPPLVAVPIFGNTEPSPCEAGTCTCGPHPTPFSGMTFTVVGVWLSTAAIVGGLGLRRWMQFRRLLRQGEAPSGQWLDLSTRVAAEVGLRRPPKLVMVSARLPPLVVASFPSATVVLPSGLAAALTSEQRTALLIHEFAHLRRGDHLVRLLESIVLLVYWWFPAVRWVCAQLHACEEACCDAAVVARRPESRRDYARLLLDVVDHIAAAPRPMGATAMISAVGLERRLRSILAGPQTESVSWRSGLLVAAIACLTLPLEVRGDWARLWRSAPSPNTSIEAAPAAPTSPWSSPRQTSQRLQEFCCPCG